METWGAGKGGRPPTSLLPGPLLPTAGQSPTQAGGAPCWGASASCPPFRLPWLRASQKEWRWLASADPLSRSGLSPEEAAGFNPSMVTVLKWDLVND